MLFCNLILTLALILMGPAVSAFPTQNQPGRPRVPKQRTFKCAEANLILMQDSPSNPQHVHYSKKQSSGFPPYHKKVIEAGFDPAIVKQNMTVDTQNIEKAGYNYMRLLFGPEQDVGEILNRKLPGVNWDMATVGFGVRGSNNTETTVMFERTDRRYLRFYRRERANWYKWLSWQIIECSRRMLRSRLVRALLSLWRRCSVTRRLRMTALIPLERIS